MVEKVNKCQKRMYAITVRNGKDIILFLSICRGTNGDVYVNFPRDKAPEMEPHSSFHASGQHHQKSFGYISMFRQRQKPDANFRGSANVVTTGIATDEPRDMQTPFQKDAFQEVFEIPIGDLRAEKYLTMISVDITEAGGTPIITKGAKVILQHAYRDAIPWIQVTLYETGTQEF